MKKTIAALIAATALITGLGACSVDAPDQVVPSTTTSTPVGSPIINPTPPEEPSMPATDYTAYLSGVRENLTDDITDARLIELGEATCAHVKASGWGESGPLYDALDAGEITLQTVMNVAGYSANVICPELMDSYITYMQS